MNKPASVVNLRDIASVVVFGALLLGSSLAGAIDTATPCATADVPNGSPVPRTQPDLRPFGARPVPAAALATQRGGDAVSIGAPLQGSVSNNAVAQSATGSNTLAGGALAGSSGLATVIQNTGNNVLIQNAVVVNLQLK